VSARRSKETAVEAVARSLLTLAAWTMSRQGFVDPVADGDRPGQGPPSQGAGDVPDGGGAAVVEGLAGAEALDVVVVVRGGGGQDVVAGCGGELDGVAADAGGAAPDKHGLTSRLGMTGRQAQAEQVALEQAAGGSGQAQREHGSLLVAQVVGGRRAEVFGFLSVPTA